MNDLQRRAIAIRLRILEMANRSKGPHVGSSLSCVDMLTALYFRVMRLDPARPDDPGRDYLVMSKGHAAMALYAALAEKGVVDPALLAGYMADNGTLPAHLDRFSAPGIEVSAGSLGHGLPMAMGLAHGLKLRGLPGRVFVIQGDGETQEGSVWEAAMKAPVLGLDNLVVLVDHNNLQGYGRPCEIMHFSPQPEKWESFGWLAATADGHDFASLGAALDSALAAPRPAVVVCKTVKGKGVSFMEDELKWHYFILTDALHAQAREELLHA